jgi:hypothetical protein
MSDVTQERRKGQRVEANLKLEVTIPRPDGGQEPVHMETLNISSSGIYFKSDHFIEPMTKLDMQLELPTHRDAEGRADEFATASCEGIVVRVLPETEGPDVDHYEVAVFFTQIDEDGMRHLSDHINMLLAVG